jgi:general secretion pathway protein K
MITALLVVMLATTAVISLVGSQHLSVRRSELLLHGDQAYLHALGVEDWARGVLMKDMKKNEFDGLTDLWGKPLPKTEILGGEVEGAITDLQGRFNLNNLMRNGEPDPKSGKQFERLLTALGLKAELAQTLIDWMVKTRVKEEGEHKVFAPFADISELRELESLEDEQYQALVDHVTALPERTAINVNTATVAVMASFFQQQGLEQAKGTVEQVKTNPFETLDAVRGDGAMNGLAVPDDAIAVSSHYFMVTGKAHIVGLHAHLSSLLQRDSSIGVRVFARQRGEYGH